MAERGQYSLKELLCWLTVWSVGLGILVALIPEPIGVAFLAVWFAGTTVVNKGFGYRAGFWYAAAFGIVFCLLTVTLATPISNKSAPPRLVPALTFLLIFGIGSGAFVWAVSIGLDKLFKLFSSST
jgi:hypothetical protein